MHYFLSRKRALQLVPPMLHKINATIWTLLGFGKNKRRQRRGWHDEKGSLFYTTSFHRGLDANIKRNLRSKLRGSRRRCIRFHPFYPPCPLCAHLETVCSVYSSVFLSHRRMLVMTDLRKTKRSRVIGMDEDMGDVIKAYT